jgi:tryptophan synthase alpha chain
MNRLSQAFEDLGGRKALLPFLMAGHPSPAEFTANLRKAAQVADIIEVGIPFSDPLADGPVIQAAGSKALRNGTTFSAALDMIREAQPAVPVVLMAGVNQVLAQGVSTFAAKASDAGVCGIIIPDLPFDDSYSFRAPLRNHGITLISMIAPTTPADRLSAILNEAEGFVYMISVAGVTGVREGFAGATLEYMARARELSPVPVCAGFGISSPSHIAQLVDVADGFVVGSALIRAIDDGQCALEFLTTLRNACAGAAPQESTL